ncbi:MAG: hypothetical protein KDE19_07855, partial [Caldilineaceae bacterium]|nr:hypothetical protein [Caldilineaceae bacterium]
IAIEYILLTVIEQASIKRGGPFNVEGAPSLFCFGTFYALALRFGFTSLLYKICVGRAKFSRKS